MIYFYLYVIILFSMYLDLLLIEQALNKTQWHHLMASRYDKRAKNLTNETNHYPLLQHFREIMSKQLCVLSNDNIDFPDPINALDDPEGLLAIGGDLSTHVYSVLINKLYFRGFLKENLFYGGARLNER